MSLMVKDDPATNFHMGSAKFKLKGDPVLMAIPIKIPKNLNIVKWCEEVRVGLNK